MDLHHYPILSIIWLLPLAIALILLLLPVSNVKWLRRTALLGSFLPFLMLLLLFVDFDRLKGHQIYNEQLDWFQLHLPPLTGAGNGEEAILSVSYSLGVDGLSLTLLTMTSLIFFVAFLLGGQIKKRRKAFYIWLYILQSAVLGIFIAQDFVLFVALFQLAWIAMYFLIQIWGEGDKDKAAGWLLAAGSISSMLMLLSFVLLSLGTGMFFAEAEQGAQMIYRSNYTEIWKQISDPAAWGALQNGYQLGLIGYLDPDTARLTAFVLLLLAFGLLLPIFPLHTWTVYLYRGAPYPIAIIFAAVFTKIGAFGIIRYVLILFPWQADEWMPILVSVGLINMLAGAWLAYRQTDFKSLLAYLSISYSGMVILGLAATTEAGFQGAVLQIISHSLIIALLLMIGGAINGRTGTVAFNRLGGFAGSLPFMSGMLLTASLALAGIPGMSGFTAILLIGLGLIGSMKWVAAVVAVVFLLAAVVMLRAVARMIYGQAPESYSGMRDARWTEAVPMIILLSFIVLVGCYPHIVTGKIDQIAAVFVQQFSFVQVKGG